MAAFEIDSRKLRNTLEPTEKWLEAWPGRAYRLLGLVILVPVALALFVGFVLLVIAFPDFGLGLAVFAIIVGSALLETLSRTPVRR